jgi:hypothetical protein
MNLYAALESTKPPSEAAELRTRLAAWHDEMVEHERRLRAGRGLEVCDEDCPHAEARLLWTEALATFGARAHELAFLRLIGGTRPSNKRSRVPANSLEWAGDPPAGLREA